MTDIEANGLSTEKKENSYIWKVFIIMELIIGAWLLLLCIGMLHYAITGLGFMAPLMAPLMGLLFLSSFSLMMLGWLALRLTMLALHIYFPVEYERMYCEGDKQQVVPAVPGDATKDGFTAGQAGCDTRQLLLDAKQGLLDARQLVLSDTPGSSLRISETTLRLLAWKGSTHFSSGTPATNSCGLTAATIELVQKA